MKKTTTACALTLLVTAPAIGANRHFTVTDFDRVQVEGPFAVTLATDNAPAASVTGDNKAIDRMSIKVQGRILRVRPSQSGWGGYPGEDKGTVRITLATHALRSASVMGSGSLDVDKAKAMRFDIAVSGNGRINIGKIEADILVIGLLGSGKIAASGTAKTLRATIQGSGDFDAGSLAAEHVEINADTSGTIAVNVSGTANIIATGPGDTNITGPAVCTVKRQGSGTVRCGK